jgi:beta-phosphoglucomutase-like phosphatase (HAD superfamily)
MRFLSWMKSAWLGFYRPRAQVHAELNLRMRAEHEQHILDAENRRLSRQLADAKERLAEAEQLNRLNENKIEVQQEAIDGMATVVATYREQFAALTRILAMKGQPVNVSDSLNALALADQGP